MRNFLLLVIGFFILMALIIAGPKTNDSINWGTSPEMNPPHLSLLPNETSTFANVPAISSLDWQTQGTEIHSPEFFSSGVPWAREISGSKSVSIDQFVRTTDGGFVMAGETEALHYGWYDYDGLCVKFNASGKVVWKKEYGGYKNEWLNFILQTQDNGLLLVGSSQTDNHYNKKYDAWVVKTNATGDIMWKKWLRHQFPQTQGLNYDSGFDRAIQTSDGGYLLAGQAEFAGQGEDRVLMKIDALGNLIWEKLYETEDDDGSSARLVPTNDGGYLLCCYCGSTTTMDFRLLKVDSLGTPVWQKTYGEARFDYVSDLIAHKNGGFVFAGYTQQAYDSNSRDAWVVRLDEGGNIVWQKKYRGAKDDSFSSIQQTKDGGFIAAGRTNSFSSTDDAWVVKLSATGNIRWQYRLIDNDTEGATKVLQTPENKYVVAGYVRDNSNVSKSFLHQLSSTGLSGCPNMSIATKAITLGAQISVTSQQVTLKENYEVVYNNSSIISKTAKLKVNDGCK